MSFFEFFFAWFFALLMNFQFTNLKLVKNVEIVKKVFTILSVFPFFIVIWQFFWTSQIHDFVCAFFLKFSDSTIISEIASSVKVCFMNIFLSNWVVFWFNELFTILVPFQTFDFYFQTSIQFNSWKCFKCKQRFQETSAHQNCLLNFPKRFHDFFQNLNSMNFSHEFHCVISRVIRKLTFDNFYFHFQVWFNEFYDFIHEFHTVIWRKKIDRIYFHEFWCLSNFHNFSRQIKIVNKLNSAKPPYFHDFFSQNFRVDLPNVMNFGTWPQMTSGPEKSCPNLFWSNNISEKKWPKKLRFTRL